MFSSLGTGSSSVVLEENCRLIVLINNLRMDIISLAFQEVIRSEEMRHQIISCNTVEILVFSLCLIEVDMEDPFPKDAVPPVWILASGCIP